MPKYVFSNKGSYISARKLADALSFVLKERVVATKHQSVAAAGLFVRYGNAERINGIIDTARNDRQFILLCSNKEDMSHYLLNRGFYTPTFHSGRYITPDTFPVLVRSTLTSSHGKGITVCKTKEEFDTTYNPSLWWTKYIKTSFEVRVLVAKNMIFRVFKKENTVGQQEEFPIRNLARGYHFSLRDETSYPRLSALVNRLSALPIFDNQFYGLDAGYDSIRREYFIYEVNSAPGLNDNSAEALAKLLTMEA